MAIRTKEVNGKRYVYFIHYPNGRKVDVYCGAESKPESRKRVLEMEIDETERQVAELGVKLADLRAQLDRAVKAAARASSSATPPPQGKGPPKTKPVT